MEHSSSEESTNSLHHLLCSASPILTFRQFDLILPIILVIFLSITALVGNILILIALHKISSLHPPSKLLFRCLAVTDISVALVAEPLHVIHLFSLRKTNEQGAKVCFYTANFAVIISTTLCGVSLLTTAAISVDRLLALVLGVRYRIVVTLKRTFAAVLSFWVLGIILAAVSFRQFTIRKSMMFAATAVILVCLAVSTICYTRMILILRQRQNQVGDPPNQATISPNARRLKKIVYSALWVQGTLEACYIPFIVVSTMFVFNSSGRSKSLYIAWEFTGILIFLSSSLNPFLYCYKINEVREAVKHTIRKVFFCLSN